VKSRESYWGENRTHVARVEAGQGLLEGRRFEKQWALAQPQAAVEKAEEERSNTTHLRGKKGGRFPCVPRRRQEGSKAANVKIAERFNTYFLKLRDEKSALPGESENWNRP